MKQAVLVIDMLNDFVTGELRCERADPIIPKIKTLVEEARKNEVPVVYCNDAHLSVDHELKRWGPHGMKGTKGAEVIPELKPAETDYVSEKRVYSAFHGTGLDNLLGDMGVDTVIITGLHTNICDRHTAASAFFRGYQIIVPEDAVEAFTQKDQEEGLAYLKDVYMADVRKTADIIEEWRTQKARTKA